MQVRAEEKRKVESGTEHVSDYKNNLGFAAKRTEKVITTITEYLWKFQAEWELVAFEGSSAREKAVVLAGRKGDCEIKTSTESAPRPQVNVLPPVDVNLTWLLQQLSVLEEEPAAGKEKRCDPSFFLLLLVFLSLSLFLFLFFFLFFFFFFFRSREISYRPAQRVLQDAPSQRAGGGGIRTLCRCERVVSARAWLPDDGSLPGQQGAGELPMGSIEAGSVFVPVVPLLEERGSQERAGSSGGSNNNASPSSSALLPAPSPPYVLAKLPPSPSTSQEHSSVLLPVGDVNAFLGEQRRSLAEKFRELGKGFPETAKLVTATEARAACGGAARLAGVAGVGGRGELLGAVAVPAAACGAGAGGGPRGL